MHQIINLLSNVEQQQPIVMSATKRKDGFLGEKQINVPKPILTKYIQKKNFSSFLIHYTYWIFPKSNLPLPGAKAWMQ